MSSSFGEHLAALVAVGTGLQCRVYNMHTELHGPTPTRPSFFKDTDYDRVRKSLDKNFPRRELASKEKGWEKLNEPMRAQQIAAELYQHYDCIKECAKFRDLVLSALRKAPGTILKDPRGNVPTDEQYWPGCASRAFLDLVCCFTRLQIQLERIGSDMRVLVAAYNSAYFSMNARDEDDFQNLVCTFVKQFEDGHAAAQQTLAHSLVLRTLVTDLVRNDESVVDLVAYLLEKVRHWFVSSVNKDHNVWQIETFACMLSEPASQASDLSRCAPVCYRQRARSWVVWGLLLCPAALASQRTKYTENARLETLLRAILSENVVEPLYRDHVIRLHEEFFEIFTFFPGKQHQFPQVKERFESFLTMKPKKLVNECAVECANRAALVHRERRVVLAQLLLNALTFLRGNRASMGPKFAAVLALLASSRDELAWYFSHHRTSAPKLHSTGMMTMFTGTATDTGKFTKDDWVDPVRVAVLISMHTALFEEARQLWWIGERYSNETLQGPMLSECHRRGLVEHASQLPTATVFAMKLLELRNETLIQPSTGSMYSTCSGFGDEFLPHLFFHLTLLEDDGSGSDPVALRTFAGLGDLVFSPHLQELFEDALKDQSRHCLGYFDLLSSAHDALNAYCPEEYPVLGDIVCGMADSFLFKIQSKLQNSLDELMLERNKLDSQFEAIKALDRLLQRQTLKQQAKQLLPLQPAQQQQQQQQQQQNASKIDLKPGFESKPRYREYTVKLARAQRGVRGICASLGRQNSNAVLIWNRTYVLREYLRETLTAWLEQKLRGAFVLYQPSQLKEYLSRTFDTVRFACEHAGFDSAVLIRQAWLRETSEESGTMVDLARQALIQFLDTKLSLYVYSDFSRAFVRYPSFDTSGEWLNEKELKCLSSVLGERGTATIQRQFSSYVADMAAKVKRWLLDDESLLQDFKRACAVQQPTDVLRCAKALKHGDEVCQTLRVLGATLQLARLLGNAEAAQNLLYAVEINPLIWALLPFAVSASLVSQQGEFWKSADFVTGLDCHANNAHLVATSVLALLKRTQDSTQLKSRELDFIRTFSLMLLVMKRDQNSDFKDWPLRGCTLFLEKIVKESSYLTPKLLDQYLPSPIIHAAVIDRTLGKVHGSEPGMGLEELSNVIKIQTTGGAEDEEEMIRA